MARTTGKGYVVECNGETLIPETAIRNGWPFFVIGAMGAGAQICTDQLCFVGAFAA